MAEKVKKNCLTSSLGVHRNGKKGRGRTLKKMDFDKKLVWRTNEGFNVNPMYRAEDIANLSTTDSLPGEYPYVRGTRVDNNWLVRQDIKVTDVKEAIIKALDILKRVWNRWDSRLPKI